MRVHVDKMTDTVLCNSLKLPILQGCGVSHADTKLQEEKVDESEVTKIAMEVAVAKRVAEIVSQQILVDIV